MKQRLRPKCAPRVEWIPDSGGGWCHVYVTDGVLSTVMPVIPELETKDWALRMAAEDFDDMWRHVIRPRASRMRAAYRRRRR